mgnify:CR=1 FL=1
MAQAPSLLHTPSGFSESAWLLSSQPRWRCILLNTSSVQHCTTAALSAGPPALVAAPTSQSEEGRTLEGGGNEQVELR